MNGIIFGYINGYDFDAELTYEWVDFFHTPVTSVHRTKFYLKYTPLFFPCVIFFQAYRRIT